MDGNDIVIDGGVSVTLPDNGAIYFPPHIVTVLKMLNEAGFEAFAVGGCVRDAMMGITPHDYDVCTDAETEDIKKVFDGFNVIETGIKHGTVTVLSGGKPIEITTYRIDGDYKDHRRPEKVIFTKSIEDDLKRRDFTVNAMAVSLDGKFCCAGDGVKDLKDGVIRCVGVAENRFSEDALRILRAMRFAARFGFEIEEETFRAMKCKRNLLAYISSERIFAELSGLLLVEDGKRASRVLDICKDIVSVIIPEFKPAFNCDQSSRHHKYNVWQHILHTLDNAENDIFLRWALFLHDICKPYFMVVGIDGRGHFPGHDFYGAAVARDILKRLKAPGELCENVYLLIKYHDLRLSPSRKNAAKILQLMGEENALRLLKMMRYDILAQSSFRQDEKLEMVELLEKNINKYIAEQSCLNVKDLCIGGSDIIALGIKPGPRIKEILNELLESVIDGNVENDRQQLLLLAEKIVKR